MAKVIALESARERRRQEGLWQQVEVSTRRFALGLFPLLAGRPDGQSRAKGPLGPGGDPVKQLFTTGMIIRWLQAYTEWREELDAGITILGSSVQTDLASYRGCGYPGGPTAQAAVRHADITQRVQTVEWWLAQLEPWERIAADYWMNVKTVPDIADEVGVEYRQARRLVEVLPAVIWLRLYGGPFT